MLNKNIFNSLQEFNINSNKVGKLYSLTQLEEEGLGKISKLPITIRIILESMLRNYDGKSVTKAHIEHLANWKPNGKRDTEIPFKVSRVILQDYTGVPLLADLGAMRDVAASFGKDPKLIEPLVPVSLIIDHSIQTNFTNRADALSLNMELEFKRNSERYKFLKWGMQAFENFLVIPPGVGIVHQINLEYLSQGIISKEDLYYPDTVVGTDSHTTMINGIGVVGWGVGGIEAEAAMLGQPIYMLEPDVVGVHLYGKLKEGTTATDLVLSLTEMLRKEKVVGKFVEYFGEGCGTLSVPDRATIANMAPDYGATMGFFPVDEQTINYFILTGRNKAKIEEFQRYFEAQGLFGVPAKGTCSYTEVLEFDLSKVNASIAGPKRPQDRINLHNAKHAFNRLLTEPTTNNGYGKVIQDLSARYKYTETFDLGHGDILIAGITSCTNTSNPSLLISAGLLAKKAVEKGLRVSSRIKTSITPGSRAVGEYLRQAGLQQYLDKLGFQVVGYGCATCVGNVGQLDKQVEEVVQNKNLIVAAVLSGNRNFEARIHQSIRANFLMSPPLVIAFAIAGRVNIDMQNEPVGIGENNEPIYLKDIWPTQEEVNTLVNLYNTPDIYQKIYSNLTDNNSLWDELADIKGDVYNWDEESTYIAKPPFFDGFSMKAEPIKNIVNARSLIILGDSITTDHISPAGTIKASSSAGEYLKFKGAQEIDFNSFGARSGHHEIMMRGTFSNSFIRNLMIPGSEGGVTIHYPSRKIYNVYDAAMKYMEEKVPTIVFAGEEYGTGSSRDWAAKGTKLLGINAVIAKSFERIHRSNLIGMGILPCQFYEKDSVQSLQISGDEEFDIVEIDQNLGVNKTLELIIKKKNGDVRMVPLILRIDTETELEYYKEGGILPFVLRSIF